MMFTHTGIGLLVFYFFIAIFVVLSGFLLN